MLPLTVRLTGRRVILVGAGPVAARKLAALLDEGADVLVVAPDAEDDITAAAARGRLRWEPRRYRREDLDGAILVVAATGEEAVNDRVAADAEKAGVLCVRIDGGGTADFSAAVRRGPLLVSVATGGEAPALAAWLRADLEERYGPEYGALAALMGELRSDPGVQSVLEGLDDEARRRKWRSFLGPDILGLLRSGHIQAARELAFACLSSSSD